MHSDSLETNFMDKYYRYLREPFINKNIKKMETLTVRKVILEIAKKRGWDIEKVEPFIKQ